jgi:hypothetical protein
VIERRGRARCARQRHQLRAICAPRVGVVDDDRSPARQRRRDELALPRAAPLVVRHQIFRHQLVRRGEALAIERRLSRRRQPDEDDQLGRHHFIFGGIGYVAARSS